MTCTRFGHGLTVLWNVFTRAEERNIEVIKKLLFQCPVIPEVLSGHFFKYRTFLLKATFTEMPEAVSFLLSHPIYLLPHKKIRG